MKHFFATLCAVIFLSASSVAAERPSTFHRMLLLNETDQILVIKIKDYDVWVTPGWYQNQEQTVGEGLEALMADYGLTTSQPQLRGMFTLSHRDKADMSTRLYHVARLVSGELKLPDIISEAKWVSLGDAADLFSFEHISAMTRQVLEHPGSVWGGAMERRGEGFGRQAVVTDPFHPIFGQ